MLKHSSFCRQPHSLACSCSQLFVPSPLTISLSLILSCSLYLSLTLYDFRTVNAIRSLNHVLARTLSALSFSYTNSCCLYLALSFSYIKSLSLYHTHTHTISLALSQACPQLSSYTFFLRVYPYLCIFLNSTIFTFLFFYPSFVLTYLAILLLSLTT